MQNNLYSHSSFLFRGDDDIQHSRFVGIDELDQPTVAFHTDEPVDLSTSSMFNPKCGNMGVGSNNLQYGTLNTSIGSADIVSTGSGCLDTGQFVYQKGITVGGRFDNGVLEKWGDSGVPEISQQTDTSTDVDTDERNQFHGVQNGAHVTIDSIDNFKAKPGDHKMLRRLAQNREAARKSRLRKKAYVEQLESSRVRLTQLEQELQRARQQGFCFGTGTSGDHAHTMVGNGVLAFDMDYSRWLDEHVRLINDLRTALNACMGDVELRILVDGVMAHHDEIFRIKTIGVKSNVFHILSGMWKTPAERCFMWLGGFRSSEILKILGNRLEPVTDQQLMGICNLQQSSQQAEDALSQGMEALQQSLLETLSSTSMGPTICPNVADYMGQMAIAMGKLGTLENFVYQADLLRQQTLHQMHRILTTRQAAQAFLVISDYNTRLRALSSLWLARPTD